MYTINEIEKLMSMGFSCEQIARMSAEASAPKTKGKKPTGKAAPQPKAEKVEFTKKNGQTVLVTPKQAAAWEAYRDRGTGRKPLDEVKAEWAAAHAAYKPSKALIDAIKADRAAVTHKVARDQYGFVGTKAELKELKAKVCAK